MELIIKNINDNKMDDAINIAYGQLDNIKELTKNYCFNIKDFKDDLVEFESYPDLKDIKNSKDIKQNNILNQFRNSIYALLMHYKHNTLKESDEIKSQRTNINYNLIIADDEIKTKLFILYLFVYYIESCTRRFVVVETDPDTLNSKPHVGIDYEFNNRIIALMQLSFETYSSKTKETDSFIWIVNPGEFDEEQNRILIKYLMTNQDIYKILHGPDSLDIPYMYEIMFKNDKKTILEFTKKIIDTRFLCEYVRLSLNLDRKCSIYDALKYFGTISDEKHKELEDTHESMGPVQDISWNIHKMSSYHKQYALYDVLFLKHYIMDIYKKINNETPEYLYSYNYVNPIIRFVILDRRAVIEVVQEAKDEINPINNYMIRYKKENYTLVTIFNELIEKFKVCLKDNECIDFNFLLLVGFLRKSLLIILKKIVYYVIRENYTVFMKKDEKWNDRIDLESTYKLLKKYELFDIIKLIDLFKNEAYKKISIMYPKKS